MTKRMSVGEARANFSDLIGSVYYGKEPVVVERKGKPMVVLISPEQFDHYQEQVKERFFTAVGEVQRLNVDEDPDEVLRAVTEVVDRVRQERYDRKQPGNHETID